MYMRCLTGLALVLLLALPLHAADKVDLDVTRIALFSSGVGYFECDRNVHGYAEAELKFRTGQINDIIKSMVVQDFDGGRIGAISYASQDPIEKTLRSFGVDLTGNPTLGNLLDQLRGEPVEIAGLQAITGIIVGVQRKQVHKPDGGFVEERELLTVLTDDGLRRVPLDTIDRLRLVNQHVDAELRKALATLATGHDADKKSVTLSFEGEGDRRVRVAYLLEAPIWKTSYRLVLADENKPFIQGWATVENATEEDWNDVRLSLVSGRPISFVMDLYTPLYVPRPVEQLELYASLRPPDYEADAGDSFERARSEAKAIFGNSQAGRSDRSSVAPMAPATKAMRRGGAAVYALAEEVPDREDMLGVSLEHGVESVATAEEAGELFEYRIAAPVSIPRQHSAMLPIVNQELRADKVSIYNPATHAKHPLNGLELTNTTGLHLMQGPVTVFDGNIYAGDAKLPDLKPAEKRLLAYALDLSTEVTVKQQPQPDEIVSLRIRKGILWHRHKYRDSREYVVKNKADKARTVLLEQPFSEQWQLIQPKEPYEKTKSLLRFKVQVPAQQSATEKIVLERVADQSLALMHTGLDDIRFYLRSRVISPAVKQALERIVSMRVALDDLARKRAALEQQRSEHTQDQARIRDNLRTLDRNTDAYRRQLTRFDEVDARITSLAAEIDQARQAEERQRKELETYMLSLDIE
jgi:hypothetical protein